MKILNVTAQKPDSTGSGVYLAEMVRCQVAAGHETAVICGLGLHDDPALPAGTLVRAVRFETAEVPFSVCGMSDEMPYRSTRYRDLTPEMARVFADAFSRAVDEVDASFKPDVVICHHLYLATAIVRERLPHRRVGAVCHSTDLRQMGKHDLERGRIVAAVRGLDAVLALHDGQKREIVDVYGVDPQRVHVVGTGFNDRVFCREEGGVGVDAGPGLDAGYGPDAGPGAPARPFELVYAGKIWAKKGVPNLIGALDAVDAGERGLVLRLAGGHSDPQEYERIRAQARGCRFPVEFLGKLPQPDLARAYRRADVFVLPSFFEGLPLVVVEALACGCKVVMTDLPVIRPWLDANAPGAAIAYVEPPRMRQVDEPRPEDLPAFEQRLAAALERSLRAARHSCDLGRLSWENVTQRALFLVRDASGARYTAQ